MLMIYIQLLHFRSILFKKNDVNNFVTNVQMYDVFLNEKISNLLEHN